MRILIVLPLAALAAACNVSTDNNAVTVQYDQNTAANAVQDAGNTAQNIGDQMGNEAQVAANAISNQVGGDNSSENETANSTDQNRQ